MTRTITTIEGRGGIILPVPDLEAAQPIQQKAQFLHYFQNLWALNDFDVSCETQTGDQALSRPFNHELVIPPSYGKPLVVVLRASFTPIYTPIDERLRRKQLPTDTTLGRERYKVLVPPSSLGSFHNSFEVAYTHTLSATMPRGLFNDHNPRVSYHDEDLLEKAKLSSREWGPASKSTESQMEQKELAMLQRCFRKTLKLLAPELDV